MKIIFISGFIAASLMLNTADVRSQRRVDTIPTTMGCYRQAIMPISAIPTLHSDMPIDCIFGYIYVDSLCRSLQSYHQADSFISLIDAWDTMRVFMRFLYDMQAYNADIYEEYMGYASDLDTNYHIAPRVLELKFAAKMDSILGHNNKLKYLTVAPIILHIRVADTGMSYDSLAHVPFSPQPRMCVSAWVLDTIKGTHLRVGDCGQYRETKGKVPLGSGCINIAFCPYTHKSFGQGDGVILGIDTITGQIFYRCDSCFGERAFVPGKEYIVFLEDLFLDYNGSNSFYEFIPYAGYSNNGGIFSLDGSGNVLDEDNFFGYGNSVPLSMFEANLKTDIQSIITH